MTNHEAWNFLHDGEIASIDGVVPGDIRLVIDIPYLRKAFPEQGTAFVLTLFECTALRLEADKGATLHSLAEIAGHHPILLSITCESPLSIYTTEGTLHLEYAGLSISLESGTNVQLSELDHASERYWTAWSAGHSSGA